MPRLLSSNYLPTRYEVPGYKVPCLQGQLDSTATTSQELSSALRNETNYKKKEEKVKNAVSILPYSILPLTEAMHPEVSFLPFGAKSDNS